MNIPITSMTTAQKLEAMEQLWTSLQNSKDFDHPEWHRQILAERQGRIDRGETKFSTVSEVRDRLRDRTQ
ncbi:MAG: addiction module protein [Planctomycetota bacterium]